MNLNRQESFEMRDRCARRTQLECDDSVRAAVFTGGPQAGAVVMTAASANLVPVTLELGGKCPGIVAPDADLDDAARRIIASRTYNGGQACLAPDHLFVLQAKLELFIAKRDAAASHLYPGGVSNSDYSDLISPRHYQRLQSLLTESQALGARVEVIGLQDRRCG